ncbi:MAG: protein kinase, partial [Acidobacteriota bacterium]|nr:protein kinase [Acidobacteriota bacterium]
MDSKRLKQIEKIYHAALEIQPGEREFFFKKHCGKDESLRREVESLLAFEKTSGNFLDTPPESLAAEMFAEQKKQTSLIDKEIGHYKIKKLLGKGGMGEVYLGEDIKLNRKVALKFLPAELTDHRNHLKRFEQEAQAASALNHPNILTIHEFGTENTSHFIVMEFVEGETVSERIERERMSVTDILEVAVQVASALSAAHEAGIIHRDIKPENIMIRRDSFVKVLDFGIAKLIEKNKDAHATNSEAKTRALVRTNPGAVIGTVDYMSPEQARGLPVDARTDIFSFGVVLYEMLSGRKPFTGETVNHTIVNILEKEPAPASAFAKDCPAELERIIQKTLAKNKDERYGAAKDLLKSLKKLQKRLEFEIELGRDAQSEAVKAKAETRIFESTNGESPIFQPNNLTENLSPLIGREKEIAEITNLLRQNNVRLLTMTGIGGTGKTRLAEAVARQMLAEFPDGVFFVNLAAITDSKLVASVIAQQLGVKETGGAPVLEALRNHLRERRLLLVVDNFEQVIEAAPDIAELLRAAANLKVLITSRELLHLNGENEYIVPSLTVPAEDARISFADLSNCEAIQFFVERARYIKPDFVLTEENADAVAEICRRLAGLPLAIELAAARIKLFAPQAILTRLSNSLKLLTGDAKDLPEPQQTMRGAIEWSYDLLDDGEKKLLNRLAVFAGGFTLDGAEAVVTSSGVLSSGFSASSSADENQPEGCTANADSGFDLFDCISSLLDKSLISRLDQTDGEPRFRMLVVVKEFALEKLAGSGETDEIRRRHAKFCADLAERAEPVTGGARSGATGFQAIESTDQPHADTSVKGATYSVSSAEYIAGEFKKRRFGLFGALAVLVVALAAIGYLTYFRAKPINSIAVLPFVNVGDDSGSDYLSDGLSENLINNLSRLPQLKVIARSSSFRFRGENIDVQDVAQKLGVAAILTGRVVRRGDDLQISVELINTADNTRIWGNIYNRKVAGALSVPEEIAQAVSQELQLKLSGAQERQMA